ncbi:amidase family protein [Nocardia sp. NPDC024068]|uniref:amidase family protein n=1 Tax=Nocardia sp. NPDC024068 TaxID=3157197 RepID=UPI0033DBD987
MTVVADVDTTVWRLAGTPLIEATAPGPLTGHTVAVKDLYALAGYTVGAGVPGYELGRAAAREHAAVPARLLAAGARIAGIAQTDEFAYSLTGSNGRFGMPVNPAAPDRIPGGSTSGPAVAVRRGEVSIGLGTDTAGSIRVPAAYQGLWGIRTTHGRVATSGLLPLAQSFDAVGWLTRDGATLAAVADCVLANEPVEPTGFVTDPALCDHADAPIAAAVRAYASGLGAGRVDIAPDDSWAEAFRVVQAFEAWANHGPWVAAHPGALAPDVAERFAFAATVTPERAAAARAILADASDRIRAAVTGRALILPATATQPPPRSAGPEVLAAARSRTVALTCLAAIAGLPAVALPLGGHDGVPVGVCLVGAPGTDRSLIRLALSSAAVLAEGPLHSEDRV